MRLEAGNNLPPVKNWREEFGGELRTPRLVDAAVIEFFRKSSPTKVIFQEKAKCTEIVLRFPVSSKQLPDRIRKAYFNWGISLREAFQETVWDVPSGSTSSSWAQLANVAHDAYWGAWLHLLKVVYRDHFHPEIDRQIRECLSEFATKQAGSAGRRRELDTERQNLRSRFDVLMYWCEDLHAFISNCNKANLANSEVRSRVFRKINGQRHDASILGGGAFAWSARKAPILHDASTWKPKQLATALLADERGCEYSTIERKIGATRQKKRTL